MRCQNLISYSALIAGLSLVAPVAHALPTDVGRTADVYEDAVRVNTAANYLVNRTVFVPQVAEAAPVVTEEAPVILIATNDPPIVYDASEAVSLLGVAPATPYAEDVVTVDMADASVVVEEESIQAAVAEVADAVEETTVAIVDVVVGPAPVDAQIAEPTLVSSVAPELVGPVADEEVALTVALAEQSNVRLQFDEAFGVPLVAVSLDRLDIPPAQAYGIDEIIPASVSWTQELPEAAVASSRRPVAATNPERLMSAMVDADENLIIRDGGEDGPDTIMMSSDVLFSFGAATLSEEAMETLTSIGKLADSVPVIEVLGHTDAIGREGDNLTLGQDRAEAVRAWLLENSAFTEDRVIATGVGEVDPVADNVTPAGLDNPDGRAQNRRVEFAFLAVNGAEEDIAAVAE